MRETNETCEHIREQLAAYALGALDDGERAAVEAHLEGCRACRELARKTSEAAHTLPAALAAASPLELPTSLKERLLERLGDEEGIPRREPAPRRPRWWRPRAALALVTLAIVALFVAWDSRLDEARSQERELRARLSKLEGREAIVFEVVDSRHTVKRGLIPPEERAESRAYGKLFTRTDLPLVVAMANRLPRPPEGRAYHLWVTANGRARLAGVMPLDEDGFGVVVFRADRPGPAYEDVRVLLQARGAKRPSGVPFLVWNAQS